MKIRPGFMTVEVNESPTVIWVKIFLYNIKLYVKVIKIRKGEENFIKKEENTFLKWLVRSQCEHAIALHFKTDS